jgi:hypothetical protein
MTWADLETIIDTSDLSQRNYTVLKAFSRHVNPPIPKRPYPNNLIVWPGMDTLMERAHCSLETVQAAKQALGKAGILELVAPAGRGRPPRYRINEQKIPRNDAAWERHIQRQERHQKGRGAVDPEPEKGRQMSHPFWEKGREVPHPFGEKGRQMTPPEVSRKMKNPEGFNFSREADEPIKQPMIAHAEDKTSETLAPSTLPLPDDFAEWASATVPGLSIPWQRDKFLTYARAHKTRNADWVEAFKLWCMNAYERWLERQAADRPTSGDAPTSATEAPDAPPRRVTCSFSGCNEPPCGHGQACRGHACCRECVAEAAAAAEPPGPREPVAVVGVDVDLDPMPVVEPDDQPRLDEVDLATSWPAEAPQPTRTSRASGALMTLGAVLCRDPEPVSAPPLRPLGGGGPRLTVRGHLWALVTQTWPRQTLLGKSKMCVKAVLHPTCGGQKDREVIPLVKRASTALAIDRRDLPNRVTTSLTLARS